MFGYMWLGAWLLTLLIFGVIVVSTGLPNDHVDDGSDVAIVAWFGKVLFLIAVAVTFYEMGAHFSGL